MGRNIQEEWLAYNMPRLILRLRAEKTGKTIKCLQLILPGRLKILKDAIAANDIRSCSYSRIARTFYNDDMVSDGF